VTVGSLANLLSVPTTTTAAVPTLPVVGLTTALARGDDAAFREFYAAYAGRLLRYALTVTHGEMLLAEEAVQLALVRIASKVRVFQEDDAFWAWLARVVRSCVIDTARRQARYAAVLERLRALPNINPSSREIDHRFNDYLQAALASLPQADRELLSAKYDDGESTADLAARAGCTPKAIESRLARVRQRVRELVLNYLRHDA
jgi:RNA polymerase sigma-70 factor (ECF subfamily)